MHAVPTFQATPSLYAMAPSKKPSPTGKARSSSSAEPHIKKVKGENFYRNAKAVARLKMLSGGKAVRDKDGKIIQAAAFQKGEDETTPGRVQPDRRWFGAWSEGVVWTMLKRGLVRREHEGHLANCVGSFSDEPFSVFYCIVTTRLSRGDDDRMSLDSNAASRI